MRKEILTLVAVSIMMGPATVLAGVITGGTLLTINDANQLESWLGVGDQDFTNIWSGDTGAAASSWHSAVDAAGPTFSIYEITHNNENYLIGGYTTSSWGGQGYQFDADAFIFNLTTSEQRTVNSMYPQYATYRAPHYFATFGGGHDIFGGYYNISSYQGYAWQGFSYGGYYDGGLLSTWSHFSVNRLETYTIADARVTDVPEPGTLAVLSLGLAALGFARRKGAGVGPQ